MDRPIYPNGKFICREDGPEIMNDYYHFNSDNVASNKEINKWVDEALTWFETNPDEPYWRIQLGTGCSTVVVLKWQDDDDDHPYYEVIVAHNYYQAYVSKSPFVRPTTEEILTYCM